MQRCSVGIANASFALATALWPVPSTSARALELAERAVTGPGVGSTALGVQIERWLAGHR